MSFVQRKLRSMAYMAVDNITFDYDDIGRTGTYRRTDSMNTWTAGDNVVFYGQVQELMLFALFTFAIVDNSITERFTLTPASEFKNSLVDIFDISITEGSGVVTSQDVDNLVTVTDNYRKKSTDKIIAISEDPGTGVKVYYEGTVLEWLAYSQQAATTGPIYTEIDFALLTKAKSASSGLRTVEIADSENGPTEFVPALTRLGNIFLNM